MSEDAVCMDKPRIKMITHTFSMYVDRYLVRGRTEKGCLTR